MIPFTKPFLSSKERLFIEQVLESRELSSASFLERCESFLKQELQTCGLLLTSSCSAALEIGALLADLEPGDEVILPSFTFPSTANAWLLRALKLVFVDIRPDTLNMDENLIEEKITARTKAICPVHYGGVAAEMDSILSIAQRHGLFVLEDAAQGAFAYYKNKPLGSLGHLGAYSFHASKNITAGEGGALVIKQSSFLERAQFLRDKGTDRRDFLAGKKAKYSWVDLGGNYLPSELNSALLYAQLLEAKWITQKRIELWNHYYEALKPYEERLGWQLPFVPKHCQHNAHLFYIIVESQASRDRLLYKLKESGIEAAFHFQPLHLSPMGKKLALDRPLVQTEKQSRRLLRLPLYPDLQKIEQERIISKLLQHSGLFV